MKKLCFVVQRYGEEINGGAEAYTRTYAERLAADYDITVLTSCALDYVNWKNRCPRGETELNGVKIIRFPVEKERDNRRFSALCEKILSNPLHTEAEALRWVAEQGPFVPEIPDWIERHKNDFDLFFFFTYLYYPTVFGLPKVAEKAVLVPFCHDEPAVYLKCFDKIFSECSGIVYNTDEEKNFVHKRFKNEKIPSVITGIGIDADLSESAPETPLPPQPYIIYMGRIDPAKGCLELFDFFSSYKKEYSSKLKLVLTGSELIPIPRRKDIISCGFVSEARKYALLRGASALVLPSHFESLSIVVLEAMHFGIPVLVSAHSAVLKGHAEKSNGGLYFYGRPDFTECLSLIESNPDFRRKLGQNGQLYVKENYNWHAILDRLNAFIASTPKIIEDNPRNY